MHDVIIIGGGLAGLVNALRLSQEGLDVVLIEKKEYPFHKVCGEYVSNEVLPYLRSIGADPSILAPADITRFAFSSPSGNLFESPLDLGGFGVSRYTLDHHLYTLAQKAGTRFMLNSTVTDVQYRQDTFIVSLKGGKEMEAQMVIGSFGKRTRLDKDLNRAFISKRSPYVGVKHHVRVDFPRDLIALHNFNHGYCGIVGIEDGKTCICYLTTRHNVRKAGSVEVMEREILAKNPFLKEIWREAEFLYEKPEVINEISFASKSAIENHILMSGDAAGLITPLCGNGMAMAIHSAKILSDLLVEYFKGSLNRPQLEHAYQHQWNTAFASRLWTGRTIQKFFGNVVLSELAFMVLSKSKKLTHVLMSKTHGSAF
jgi:menaquinone-9 beta-reductase